MTVLPLIQSGRIAIYLVKDCPEDYAKLSEWLSDPKALQFYESRDHPYTISQASETFNPARMQADGQIPCLIHLDDRPIGYIQYYTMGLADRKAYDLPDQGTIYGVDLFIGEPGLWGYGLGRQIVNLILSYLFSHQNAGRIILDPQAANLRAIRCYESCGFQKIKLLPAHELHEGSMQDCWLMGVTSEQARLIDQGPHGASLP